MTPWELFWMVWVIIETLLAVCFVVSWRTLRLMRARAVMRRDGFAALQADLAAIREKLQS